MTGYAAPNGIRPRLTVDSWDPAYGVSMELYDLDESVRQVDVDVEVPGPAWAPVTPAPPVERPVVVFVDGVRRVDAHVWIEGFDGSVQEGIFASYAAGAVRCDGLEARIVDAEVGRGLFSAFASTADVPTTAGVFVAQAAASALPAQLALALQRAMGRLELRVAERARSEAPCDLVVVDGRLRDGAHLDGSVGFVKSHHVTYLPADQHRLVARLGPGQRTPLFTLGTSWTRYSWYQRLPGGVGSPWAGVARCECSPEMSAGAARAVAELASSALPRYASEPHKDERAPQNLYPIGALERELRRRLGDPDLVNRALRVAAHATRAAAGQAQPSRE